LQAKPGSSETLVYRFRRGDGELRWIEMLPRPQRDPAVGGVVTNARDITHRIERPTRPRVRGTAAGAQSRTFSDVIS